MTIKEIRKETGLSQSEFAKKFRINKSTLANWEQGLRTPPEYTVFLIETILQQEQAIKNILTHITVEKQQNKKECYPMDICHIKKELFSKSMDIAKDKITQIK